FLAFCSKEIGVIWAPFLFVFQLARDWQSQKQGVHWPEIRRIAMDTLLVSVVPLALFLFLRERMLDSLPYPPEPHNFVRNPLADMDLVERFCMGTYVLGYGLWLCLAPFALAADYSHSVFPLVDEPTQWRFLIAAAALLLILVGGLWIRRRHPLLFLGMAAFLGFAFVISNIPIVIGTIFGERLYYAPSLGLSFAVAWLWSRLWHRWWVVLSVLLGIWTMLCTVVILQRNVVWQDDKTLFRHEVVNQPQSVRMQLCAASTFAQNDIEQAVHHIRKAMELEPEYANAWGLLGVISSDRRRDRQAEQQLTRSLTARYFDRHTDHFNGHANLGNLFHRQGRFAKAAEHYEKAMRIDPSDMDMFDQLNDMSRSGHLSRMGKDLEAILRQARDAAPYSSYWDGYLGLLAFQTGNPGAAVPLLESAVQGIPPGLYGGGPGVTLQLALADCYLAIGKHNRVMPLLSRLASQALKPDVAGEAQSRIRAAFGR
ncbi:MAG: tetratricopeptide repeat protein, partial [Planctomycetota bacterium]